MQWDMRETADAMATAPPGPPPERERSAWGAPFRSIAGAAAEVFGQIESWNATSEEHDRKAGKLQARRDREQRAKEAKDYARALRLDAATAGTAEQIVFGLTRGLAKAGAAMAAFGPVGGAAAFGASEAGVTYEDLTAQGVDKSTALKAAGASGALSAASVALPLAGSTLPRTAALYVAGGPGGFMAQQAATRSILERADYAAIARQYDPLDWTGLALSTLLPLPFAGIGAARNIRAAKAAQKPIVTAHEPDGVLRDSVEIGPARTIVAESTPAPQEAVDAAMVQNLTAHADAVDAARSMPAPVDDGSATLRAAQVAQLEAELAATLPSLGSLADRGEIRAARQRLALMEQTRIDTSDDAIKATAKTIQRREGVSFKTALQAAKNETMGRAQDWQAQADRIQAFIDSNATAQQQVQRVVEIERQLDVLRAQEPMATVQTIRSERQQRAAAATVARAFPEAPPDLPPATRDALAQAAPNVSPQMAADIAQAVRAVSSGDLSALPDVVQNIAVGLREAADNPQRLAELVRRMSTAEPSADAAANVVEGMRKLTDDQLADIQPTTIKPAGEALQQQAADHAKAVEQAAPDMPVRIRDDGTAITAADELADARKLAAEGTDTELGSLDADLLRVAADCALSFGAH